MKVRLIKNPVGRYNLSYEVGEEINLPDSQAQDLIEDGYAVLVVAKPETATDKQVKRESRKAHNG